jgi:ParB-like nuclease family protein
MNSSSHMMPIADIALGIRHRRDLGNIAELAESIANNGLLQPIAVRPDGTLIFGQRRLEAFKLLGRTKIPANVFDIEDIVFGEQAENIDRKDFTPEERVAIGAEIERVLGERRGRPPVKATPTAIPQVPGELPKKGEETADFAARKAGFGNSETYRQAKAVVEAGKRDPEKHGAALEQMNRSGKVEGSFKRIQGVKAAERGEAAVKLNGKAHGTRKVNRIRQLVDFLTEHADNATLDALESDLLEFAALYIDDSALNRMPDNLYQRMNCEEDHNAMWSLGRWAT